MLLSALPHRREAEPYEHLRDRSDQHLAENGARPALFLANLGKLAQFNARAGFARNASRRGGIAAIGEDGFTDPQALAKAFTEKWRQRGLPVFERCALCRAWRRGGSRPEGGRAAPSCFLQGARMISRRRLREAGIDAFLHQGCDLISLLGEPWAVIAGERSEAFLTLGGHILVLRSINA